MMTSPDEMLAIFLDMASREIPSPVVREGLLASMNPIHVEESWIRVAGHVGYQTPHQFAVAVACLVGAKLLRKQGYVSLGSFRVQRRAAGETWEMVAVAARIATRPYMDGVREAENPLGPPTFSDNVEVWSPGGPDDVWRESFPVPTDVLEYRIVWIQVT